MAAIILCCALWPFIPSALPKGMTHARYLINHIIVGVMFMVIPMIIIIRQRARYYKVIVSDDLINIRKGIVSKSILCKDVISVSAYNGRVYSGRRTSADGVVIYYDKIFIKYTFLPECFGISKWVMAEQMRQKIGILLYDIIDKQ